MAPEDFLASPPSPPADFLALASACPTREPTVHESLDKTHGCAVTHSLKPTFAPPPFGTFLPSADGPVDLKDVSTAFFTGSFLGGSSSSV